MSSSAKSNYNLKNIESQYRNGLCDFYMDLYNSSDEDVFDRYINTESNTPNDKMSMSELINNSNHNYPSRDIEFKHFSVIYNISEILNSGADTQLIFDEIEKLLTKRKNVINLILGLINNKNIDENNKLKILNGLLEFQKK